ncbi:DUF368 domain-containing protein [Mycoplasmatota bacterium WC44]
MIKTFLSGVVIGVANIIPGVSGGTMMVLLGIYDRILEVISNITKLKNENRIKDIIFILTILSGALIGIVGFANILDIMFYNFETQTYYLFIGLIISSLIIFIKEEFSSKRINVLFLLFGALLVLLIEFFNIDSTYIGIPTISFVLIISLFFTGIVTGGAMIIPGVSGSMLLLILGKYHLIKDYIRDLFTFKLEIIFPVLILGIGIFIGIYLNAKLVSKLIKNHRTKSLSFIIGLIIASVIILVPLDVSYDMVTTSTSFLTLVLGYLVVRMFEKI